jgi:Fe-S oxidoreductase
VWDCKGKIVNKNNVSPDLYREVERLGAKDMEACMQCGNCASDCPLSSGETTFPRRIYRYLQLGLRDKLLESPEPWLCYYCGDCNTDCPRGAEPAETMMASRRWLMTQYDWTGIARRFYTSPLTAVGAFLGVGFFVVLLFLLFHGPVVMDRVELNTFAPEPWIHLGDQIMMGFIFVMLFSNAARMFKLTMGDTKIPFYLYVTQAPVFVLNYFTQKRWRKCGTGPGSAWWRHVFLFSGWVSMEILVMAYLSAFQTDVVQPIWHWTRLLGYYATIALMFGSTTMLYSRWFKKEERLHRYSDFMDLFFLILIFATATTGIMVHIFRMYGLPAATYTTYVIHLAITVGMLTLMIPFGKLSHLMYRPLAIFLTSVKEKALRDSPADLATVKKEIGETFLSCMQCGACTGACPWNEVAVLSPRKILRDISLDRATYSAVDEAAWICATCNNCVTSCPRGIEVLDLIKTVRHHVVDRRGLKQSLFMAIKSLMDYGNPWYGKKKNRLDWVHDAHLPAYTPEQEYCLFTCCTTAYDTSAAKGTQKAGIALLNLLAHAGVSYGSLGTREKCCGDPTHNLGVAIRTTELAAQNTDMFMKGGVKKILTLSPHCLNSFRKNYDGLKDITIIHETELLDELIQKGGIKPVNAVNLTVTYHDPCYLGRHAGIYEAPRRILEAIPGLTLVEMQNNRERSFCCGGGGGGPWKEDVIEASLGEVRIKEAIATGAEVIATACPYCIRMLNESIAKLGVANRIKVRDVAELLWQSVDLSIQLPKPEIDYMRLSQEDSHV